MEMTKHTHATKKGAPAMLNETLARIEKTVSQASAIDDTTRKELLGLVGSLRSEVSQLAQTHDDHAQSIAGFAQVSTHEATRAEPNEQLLKHGLDGLSAAVREFEATHPRLTNTVNSIHQLLTNIGVG
jgi:ABC-type transporter Mla subunit MlaD